MKLEHTQDLTTLGLTIDQAKIYEVLLSRGEMRANTISHLAQIGKSQTYKVLQELETLELATKKENKGRVTVFAPGHPQRIEGLVEDYVTQAKKAESTYDSIKTKLFTEFSASTHVPGVQVYLGLSGLERVNKDVLKNKNDILLIRSTEDHSTDEYVKYIEDHIALRTKIGLSARVLTTVDTPEAVALDKKRNVTRRIIELEPEYLPAQVMIYGSKVAITNYTDPMVTTVIDNEDIRETFSILFESHWKHARTPKA